jgi:hypothetical protein
MSNEQAAEVTEVTETAETDWQAEAVKARQELAEFRLRVAMVASREAANRRWCNEIDTILSEVGLKRVNAQRRHTYRVALVVEWTDDAALSPRRLEGVWDRMEDAVTSARTGGLRENICDRFEMSTLDATITVSAPGVADMLPALLLTMEGDDAFGDN